MRTALQLQPQPKHDFLNQKFDYADSEFDPKREKVHLLGLSFFFRNYVKFK